MSQEETIEITPRSIYDIFETDTKLEEQGVKFDCGFGSFTLAYVGNPAFSKEYQVQMKPYAEAQARGLLEGKIHQKILISVYAKTIIKGWEGVIGRDGKEIPFTEENVVNLMLDLPRLFGMIREWAGNFANYRKAYAESVVGN